MCYVAKVACVLSVYSCSFQRHLLRNKIPQKTVSSLMLGGWGGRGHFHKSHFYYFSHYIKWVINISVVSYRNIPTFSARASRQHFLCSLWTDSSVGVRGVFYNISMRLNESSLTGACLFHLRGVCARGGWGLEKVRVLELCRRACPGCCCLAKRAPAKQKTDDRETGKLKGWLVCSFCSASVFTLEGCQ